MHGEKDYRVPVTQGFEYYNTLRHQGRADAARVLPRREPLDPEAAELAAVAPRVLRLAGEVRGQRADEVTSPCVTSDLAFGRMKGVSIDSRRLA